MGAAEQRFCMHPADLRQQTVVISQNIQKPGGLADFPQLDHGEYFEEFIQGAKSAGEGDGCVGKLHHGDFALVHATHYAHFLYALMAQFFGQQKIWNHADDEAAVFQYGIGEYAHKADMSAAIDQADLALSQAFAQVLGSLSKCRVGSFAGAAKNLNGTYVHWARFFSS